MMENNHTWFSAVLLSEVDVSNHESLYFYALVSILCINRTKNTMKETIIIINETHHHGFSFSYIRILSRKFRFYSRCNIERRKESVRTLIMNSKANKSSLLIHYIFFINERRKQQRVAFINNKNILSCNTEEENIEYIHLIISSKEIAADSKFLIKKSRKSN